MSDDVDPSVGVYPILDHGELFETVYTEHREPLLRFVRRLMDAGGLSEAQVDAEGVVHNAFAAALARWATIENPPAWLFTVARNMLNRESGPARRSTATREVDVDAAGPARWSSVAPRPTVEDVFHAREVVAAIADLPGKQRVATYLHHVEGWSGPEIAALMDCAHDTVYAHTYRGRAQVRRTGAATASNGGIANTGVITGHFSARGSYTVRVGAFQFGGGGIWTVLAVVLLVAATVVLRWFGVGWWWFIPLGVAALAVVGLVGMAALWLWFLIQDWWDGRPRS